MAFIHYEYWPLSPTIAKGRPPSNPVSTPWPIVQGHLHSITVRVPAGHNGLTGFRITYNGQQIMPWSNFAWEIGSGDVFTYRWEEEIMATGLVLICYNTDITPHQFFAQAEIQPVLGTPPGAVAGSPGLAIPSAAAQAAIAALSG